MLHLHHISSRGTQCQAELTERRGERRSVLGELTLVGTQQGANLESDIVANPGQHKHQPLLTSGKLR